MAIRNITFVGENSKLEVGAIVYFSQERGTELHTADCIPENLGFFKTEKELKKQLKRIAKSDFILPIRINKCWRRTTRRNGDIYFQADLNKPFYEQKSVSVSKRQMAGEKKIDYVVFASDEGRGFDLGEFKTKQEALKVAHKEIHKLKRCS